MPWDGIGCWSPVFPALLQDIQLATTMAVISLTKMIEKDMEDSQYYVYEKKYDSNGIIKGYERI